MYDWVSVAVFYIVGFNLLYSLICILTNKSYDRINLTFSSNPKAQGGIQWAGTSTEDAAYRTLSATPITVSDYIASAHNGGPSNLTNQGFNLHQWFVDQGIQGDQSYYRYSQIRHLTQEQYQAGNPWSSVWSRGNYQGMYDYTGNLPNDQIAVGAQNITSLESQGLDSWGRPLPVGYQTEAQKSALRAVGSGVSTGGSEQTPVASSGAAVASPLALGKDTTLSKPSTLGNK